MQDLFDPIFEQTVAAYHRHLSRLEADAWKALFTDDAEAHEPVGTQPAVGKADLEQVWSVLVGPFKTLSVEAQEIFHAGSGAAVKWHATGESEDGGKVEFSGIRVFEFAEDGRIQTIMSYWDPAAMMIALADGENASG